MDEGARFFLAFFAMVLLWVAAIGLLAMFLGWLSRRRGDR